MLSLRDMALVNWLPLQDIGTMVTLPYETSSSSANKCALRASSIFPYSIVHVPDRCAKDSSSRVTVYHPFM